MARVKPVFTPTTRISRFTFPGSQGSTRETSGAFAAPVGQRQQRRLEGLKTAPLVYPLFGNNDDQGGHCMVFRINKTNREVNVLNDFLSKVGRRKGIEKQDAIILTDGGGETLKLGDLKARIGIPTALEDQPPRGNRGSSPNIEQIGQRLQQAIILYMPPQVQTTYGLNYSDVDMGFMSQAMVGVFDAMNAEDASKTTKAVNKDLINAYVKGSALGALNMVAPGARAGLQIRAGSIISNKMELSFTGVNRREFQFVFNFTPKSPEEAKVIHDIVKSFKFYAHPSFIQGSKGNAMTIPDSFDIEYRSHGVTNTYLHKISTCFCTSINVQYGGDRFTAHTSVDGDGAPPTNTILTLGFKEMELITREAIREGF